MNPSNPVPAPAASPRLPLLIWAAVLAITLLSCYVHVVNSQVQRGERLREAQRVGSATKPPSDELVAQVLASH